MTSAIVRSIALLAAIRLVAPNVALATTAPTPTPTETPTATATPTPTVTPTATPPTMAKYVKDCETQLGIDFPTDLNCYDKKQTREIVITKLVDGKRKKVAVVSDLAGGVKKNKCDNPLLIPLGDQNGVDDGDTACVPYSRLGVRRIMAKGDRETEKVDIAWICRTYFFKTPLGGKVAFDDLGLILHNEKTGGTCFFAVPINKKNPTGPAKRCADEGPAGGCTTHPFGKGCPCTGNADCANNNCENLFDHPTNGTDNFPKPGTAADTDVHFWFTFDELAGRGCMRCHDAVPFLHTPPVEELTDTEAVQKMDPVLRVPRVSAGEKDPYWAVLGQALAARKDDTTWVDIEHIAPEKAAPCLECHRIGARNTCSNLVPDASGGDKNTSTEELGYAHDWWMPDFDIRQAAKNDKSSLHTEAQWNAKFKDAVAALRACCRGTKAEPLTASCNPADVPKAMAAAKACCETPIGAYAVEHHYVDESVCAAQPGALEVNDDLCPDAPPDVCCRLAEDTGDAYYHLTASHCAMLAGTVEADDLPCAAALESICCESTSDAGTAHDEMLRQDCNNRVRGTEVGMSLCTANVCCAHANDAGTEYDYRPPTTCTDELGGTVLADDAPCVAADDEVCCTFEDGSTGLTERRACMPPAVTADASACTCAALGGTTCETGGNGACHGDGSPSFECDHCCGPDLTPTCAALGGTTCEVAGNGACGGRGAATLDCDHCCGGVATLDVCPALGGSGEPLGDDDLGCVPHTRDSRRCEDRVTKTFKLATECMLKCRRHRANRQLAMPADELACEDHCRRQHEHRMSTSFLAATCPPCLDLATREALFPAAAAVVDALAGGIYCGPGTPWGNGHPGLLPADEPTVRCENRVSRSLTNVLRCITRSHRIRAAGRIDETTEDAYEQDLGSRTSCISRYLRDTAASKEPIAGCPACLDDDARTARFEEMETLIDASTGLTFCDP